MSDDIDIEEHDVMDDPVLRNIFPDLSIVKGEIEHCYDIDVEIDVKSEDLKIPWIGRDDVTSNINSDNFYASQICSSFAEDIFINNTQIEQDVNYPGNFNNKIILGSKSTKYINYEEFSDIQINPYDAKVQLDDVGSYFYTCGRYCSQCKILFLNISDLKNHDLKYHSQKVSAGHSLEKTGKIIKTKEKTFDYYSVGVLLSKVKSNLKNTDHNTTTIADSNVCFHCKKIFLNKRLLFTHLYKVLSARRKKIKDKRSTKIINKAVKAKYAASSKMTNVNDSIFHRCSICSYYMKECLYLRNHLFDKHGAKAPYKNHILKNVYFDSKCKYCFHNLDHYQSYNAHLIKSHTDMYTAKLSNKQNEELQQTLKRNNPSEETSKREILLKENCMEITENIDLSRSEEIDLNSPDDQIEIAQSHTLFYRCKICSYYFVEVRNIKKHLSINHQTREPFEGFVLVNVKFDPQCQYCTSKLIHHVSYNTHINKLHREINTIKGLHNFQLSEVSILDKIKTINKVCVSEFFNINQLTSMKTQETKKSGISLLETFDIPKKTCFNITEESNQSKSANQKFSKLYEAYLSMTVAQLNVDSTKRTDVIQEIYQSKNTDTYCSLENVVKNLSSNETKEVNINKTLEVFKEGEQVNLKNADISHPTDQRNISVETQETESTRITSVGHFDIPEEIASKLPRYGDQFHRCYICSFYFIHVRTLITHLHVKHGLEQPHEPGILEKVSFNSKCKLCECELHTMKSYNGHFQRAHPTCYNHEVKSKEDNSSTSVTMKNTVSNNTCFDIIEESDLPNSANQKTTTLCLANLIMTSTKMNGDTIETSDVVQEIQKSKSKNVEDPNQMHMAKTSNVSQESVNCMNTKINFNPKSLQVDQLKLQNTESTNSTVQINRSHETRETNISRITSEAKKNILDRDMFKCYICTCYFIHIHVLIAHLYDKHDVEQPYRSGIFDKVTFNTKCKLCVCQFHSIKSYNAHIQKAHYTHYEYEVKSREDDSSSIMNTVANDTYFGIIKEINRSNSTNRITTTPCQSNLSETSTKINFNTIENLDRFQEIKESKSEYVENDLLDQINITKNLTSNMTEDNISFMNTEIDVKTQKVFQKCDQPKSNNAVNDIAKICSFNVTNDSLLYRCNICSYYFTDEMFLKSHALNKHEAKDEYMGINGVLEKVKFISQCKFCACEMPNYISYNSHFLISHTEIYNIKLSKFENAISRKSSMLLFKCNKCDVHFTSLKIALNHAEHMELLIHWKCLACNRIFKKKDSFFHKKQHAVTDTFVTHNLSDVSLSKVLYKCSKCAVHFKDEKFLNHFCKCGSDVDSKYCNVCNILIHDTVVEYHMSMHQSEGLSACDFTIFESEMFLNVGKSTVDDSKDVYSHKISINESEKFKETINSTTEDQIIESVKKRLNSVDSSKMEKKCDSFQNLSKETVSKGTQRKRKKVFKNYVFDLCYCNTCQSFMYNIDKEAHIKSFCKRKINRICQICGLCLTRETYQNHKRLHRGPRMLKLHDFKFYDFQNKRISPPIPKFLECQNCELHFSSKRYMNLHDCGNEKSLTCNICNIEFSKHAHKLHMFYHDFNAKLEEMETIQNKVDKSQYSENLETEENDPEIASTRVLFSCSTCSLTVDTYDKAVVHCQKHYDSKNTEIIITKLCQICKYEVDSNGYEHHQTLHANKNTGKIKILKFDPFYITAENDIWIKHVFHNMPQILIDQLVSESIFKHECRVKMEVTQDGPADLTIYQCDKCCCFIDESSLYTHAENSCFKLRKLLCSYCNISFLSAISKIKHEKIHKTPNISVNSYRIVTFNRQEEKILNDRLKSDQVYVLYQCRSCYGTVDEYKIRSHKCYNKNPDSKTKPVRKCLNCGLLIYGYREYRTHLQKHWNVIRFTPRNMQLILFGNQSENATKSSFGKLPSFTGVTYDYTFYRCKQCNNCTNDKEKHFCSLVGSGSKCLDCDLLFCSADQKYHRTFHERNPDFCKEYIDVVSFLPFKFHETKIENRLPYVIIPRINVDSLIPVREKYPKDLIEADTKKILLDDFNKEKQNSAENNALLNNTITKYAKIYKCTCGLHFLDDISVSTHFKNCTYRIRASKYKCTKCDLLFTPDILFSHLLIHHGNKKHIYNFQIVELTNNETESLIIFRCPKCYIHFTSDTSATKHFENCSGKVTEASQCTTCKLAFDSDVDHECIIHIKETTEKNAYQVVDIGCSYKMSVKNLMKQLSKNATVEVVIDSECDNRSNNYSIDLKSYSDILYKCKQCSSHFLTKHQIKNHLKAKHDLTKLQDICNLCGLNFESGSLANHIYIHHENFNFETDNLTIIECESDK